MSSCQDLTGSSGAEEQAEKPSEHNTESRPTVLMPTRPDGTRWVQHTALSLNNLTKSYRYFVLHMTQLQVGSSVTSASRNKAKGFLKLLCTKAVAYFLHFLLDVTTTLDFLSKDLQRQDCVIGEVARKLETTVKALENFKTR